MTKTIYTRHGIEILVDDEDYPQLSRHGWSPTGRGYVTATIKGERVFMHRMIMSAPDGLQVDHINGNIYDNRRSNLRLATQSQNMHNRRRNTRSSSRFKGVSWHKQTSKWIVHIKVGPKVRHVGLFSDEEEAARAYDRAAVEAYGQFACLNFPDQGGRAAA